MAQFLLLGKQIHAELKGRKAAGGWVSARAYSIILIQFFFYQLEGMSCYLKISYLARHRKYRYYRDRPINFLQIRKELLFPHPASPLVFTLTLPRPHKEGQKEGFQEVQMTEQELCQHLKSIELNEKETIRIKIMEPTSKIISQKPSNCQEGGNEDAPVEMVRGNSKSDEVKVETATFPLRTDVIEITQEFLCNSTLERYDFPLSIRSEDIRRELQQNKMRQKDLTKNRKLKDISFLYSRMEAEVRKEGADIE